MTREPEGGMALTHPATVTQLPLAPLWRRRAATCIASAKPAGLTHSQGDSCGNQMFTARFLNWFPTGLKTQVYIVNDGDYYRTRITHCLEVAQLARSLARMLGLCEELAEAIALAHDVGHTPFGHAGEETLDRVLKEYGMPQGWNSNTHSLYVLDHLEFEHPSRQGLDLTYATRQGVARHHTPFDQPDAGFDDYPHPTLEAQAVNVTDLLAYVAHDTEDAVFGGLITVEELVDGDDEALGLWRASLRAAIPEFEAAGADAVARRQPEMRRHLMQRARRHFINTRSSARARCTEGIIRILRMG